MNKLKFIAGAFAVSALLLSSLKSNAQTTEAGKFQFAVGPNISIPTGDVKPFSGFSLGGTGRLQYGVTNNFAVTLSTGGDHFFAKKVPGTDRRYSSYGLIPVKAGVKFFVVPNVYVAGEAGAGWEVLEKGFFSNGQRKFVVEPAVGYATRRWDVSLRYESATGEHYNYGLLGLRLGYAIF